MRDVSRAVGVGALAVGFSVVVAVVLAVPVTAGVAQAVRGGQAGTGPAVAWSGRASLVLAGRLDLVLRLVRCPVIKNDL